jgi:2-desacetyl-2-hydroxyethyl bacteriochlorophyllide A dehydrogenase
VAPRKWELIEVDKPEPGPGQMLVRIERTAICGTDKGGYIGLSSTYPLSPGAPGHEALGIVESCPSGQYDEGERVLLYGGDRGLYHEFVLAPDDGRCIRLPLEIEPEVVLMSQLLGTVIHCFLKLDNLIDRDVVVVGQGPVGQLFNACLRNLGARKIIAVDKLAYRLEVGRQMGATHTVDASAADAREAVAELTGGELAHAAVEAVGMAHTFDLAATLVRRGGDLVYFGVPNKEPNPGVISLEFLRLFNNEVRIITSVGPNPQRDYAIARDWIVQGRLDVRPILTHVLPFEQIQEGFEMFFDRPAESKAVKVVLRF